MTYTVQFKPENPTINQYEKGKPDWSGIYIWKNKVNGKQYIGKSYRMSERPYKHIKSSSKSGVSDAIRKYGIDSFALSLYEVSPEQIDAAEQWFIKVYNSFGKNGYNKTLGGEGVLGIEVGEETREKIRIAAQNVSEETREKRRIANIGENNPNYGKTLSEETREKLRIANTGKTHSAETREKIRIAKQNVSEETREKMRIAHIGENNPNYGKTLSEETREKLRIASTGKTLSDETRAKIRVASIGKTHSEETKEKMRTARLKHLELKRRQKQTQQPEQ
jgi:group I intron endonuclease